MNATYTRQFEITANGRTTGATEHDVLLRLDAMGLLSPAAYAMPLDDVLAQVNEVNGGEVTVKEFFM